MAFWSQLTVAGLLVVLAMVGVLSVLRFPDMLGSLDVAGLLLAPAAWCAATALGLRRGSSGAYRLSVVGLLLPLLMAVAVSEVGFGTYSVPIYSVYDMWAEADTFDRFVLYLVTVGMLVTGSARRFFADPALSGAGRQG